MQIDWFTVGAQTLNFLLLVWLLKRYLYGPILKAIDARESQVAKVISDANTIKTDAELQRNLFEKKNIEVDTKRDELLKEANKSARNQSEKLVIQAHKEADEISKNRLILLEKELQHFHDDIALKMLQETYEIVRKVLTDLADIELEQKMFECFCKHLQSMSPVEKTNLKKAVKEGNTEFHLCSAFELSQAQIDKVDGMLQKITSTNSNTHYQLKQQLNTTLICGLELRSSAWVIAWNTEDYLKVLQTDITQLLTEQREIVNSKIISNTTQLNTKLHISENLA